MAIYNGKKNDDLVGCLEADSTCSVFGTRVMKAENLRWLSNIGAGSVSNHNSMIDICFRGGALTFIVYCIMLMSAGKFLDNSTINALFIKKQTHLIMAAD